MPDPDALVAKVDVEAALLRPLTTLEEGFLDQVITQATAQLTTAMPYLETRMGAWSQDPRPSSAINPATVAAVLAGIIKRAFVNPKGLWSTVETAGPFSTSETYPGARGGEGASEVPGGLVVTPGDLAKLTAANRRPLPRSARLRAGLAPGNIEI